MTQITRLPRSTAALQGISDLGVTKFFTAIENQNLELHSMMLVRHGYVVAEHWWKPFGPDKPHMLFSLSKSFTSTAIGLAVEEGLMSLTDKVISFFPEYVTPEIRENMADLQVRHLLSMSTGHVEDTMPYLHQAEDGDWVKAFFGVPIQKVPGTHFLYNTGATYMLSAILQRVSRQTLLEYLTPRLFEPLGIVNPTWETCPRGINTGGFGLSIRTEDIAKFGELYLRRGMWGDKRIVPEAWVDNATKSHISNGNQEDSDWAQGYGYQFWRCRHNVYRGDGAFGQFCIVMPEKDAVIAITSGVQDMQAILNVVWETLLPAMSEETTMGDGGVVNHSVVDAVGGPSGIDPDKRLTPTWSDVWYTLEENPFSLNQVKVSFDSDGFVFYVVSGEVEWQVHGGYSEWMDGQRIRFNHEQPIREAAVQGGWRSQSTFVIAICLCETPFTYTIGVSPDDDGINATISVNVSFHQQTDTVIHGTAGCGEPITEGAEG